MINLANYGKEIVSLLVPFVTWWLNTGAKPKAKLHWTSPHAFTFLVQEPLQDAQGVVVRPTQTVCTASVRVINSGREAAHRVELVFNFRPQYLNLWPVRSYEERTDADRRHMMIFENLAPKEELGIEIMSVNQDLPALLQVRSAECVARQVQLMWFAKVAQWRIQVARLLMFIGLAAAVYWLITLVQLLVLKTPLPL
jgi:hypothetical protein